MKTDQRVRLEFLDGIRGLAALYVMIGHAYVYIRVQVDSALPPLGLKLFKLIDLGHYAVAVFIVLSGYCLMLPVARSATSTLAGGWFGYITRRARRIMPTYYAAMIVSALLLIVFPQVAEPGDLSWGSIATHLLLIHNLFPAFLNSLNGPMWSVAMEWQIYFFLPFVLLPVWRRFGNLAAVLVGLAAGLAPIVLLPADYNFAWTNPWYIGLFAMGMVAAAINFSPRTPVWLHERMPWQMITLALIAVMTYLLIFKLSWSWENLWFSDGMMGLTTAAALIFLAQRSMAGRQPRGSARSLGGLLDLPARTALRLLESPWIVGLGAFSYSLYLIHEPLLVLISSYLLPLELPLFQLLAVQLFVSLPFTLMLCYLFFLAFERPFMKQRKAGAHAAGSGAPAQGQVANDEPMVAPVPLLAQSGLGLAPHHASPEEQAG